MKPKKGGVAIWAEIGPFHGIEFHATFFEESLKTPRLISKSSFCPRAATAPLGEDGPVAMKNFIKMQKVTKELQT